jgi:tetratricopeptide (TPR) repeat protein
MRGDEALRLGRLNDAIRAYREALALEPDSAWYHQSLGEVSARKGWYLVAGSFFRRALQLDPDDVARWYAVHTPNYATDTPLPEPVFVLGCPHSGTTITARVLARHPRLMHAEARETQIFAFERAEVDRQLRQWDRACVDAGKSRWVEKSVLHTFMVPKLLAARPRAKFVIVVRDGRDVVASLKTRRYAFSGLDDLISCWTLATDLLQQLAQRPGAILIRYEDLVRTPRETLTRVCEAVGESRAPEMLEHDGAWIAWNGVTRAEGVGELGAKASHSRLRAWQVNQPLFDGSGRWRRDLSRDECRRIKALAQCQLELFGYVQDDTW